MFLRSLLAIFVCQLSPQLWAADTPAPNAGKPAPAAAGKGEEFTRLNKEFNDLVAELTALKTEYNTSTDTARKATIHKQYYDGLEKAAALEKKLVEAAEDAYAEAPNAAAEPVLVRKLYQEVVSDDYEPAFKLGKLLMDRKCTEKHVPALAGVAAYCVNEYDLAEAWLQAASDQGNLSDEYARYLSSIAGAKRDWAREKKIREAEAKADDLPRVELKTTAGDIEIELFENEAPNTVLNFITLVDKGFYNGLKFHRVLPGFMAQGGDPKGDGTGGPGYMIPCECFRPDYRRHFRGSLSMAHQAQPNTGGSQFFLTFVPTKHLDGKHTAFGRVISGFEALAKLKRRNPEEQTAGAADTIISAKVIRRRPHAYDAKDLKKSANSD